MFNLRRIDMKGPIARIPEGEAYRLTGQQREWGANIPLMYAALASPSLPHMFARRPRAEEQHPWDAATVYWASLLHLLVYQFGWSRPDVGLERLLSDTSATDDPRIALIRETWFRDRQIKWFAAWMWTNGRYNYLPNGEEPGVRAPRIVDVDDEWIHGVTMEIERARIISPLVGGTDPLHLGTHIQGPLMPTEDEVYISLDPTGKPRGVLVSDSMVGWYLALLESPLFREAHPSGRSWRVDVIVRPVGWLGEFRRSRDTGLWFAGRHHIHRLGNP